MAVLGFWLFRGDEGQSVNYGDTRYRQAVKNSVRHWIACFKNHPSVLAWCLGNEVHPNLNPSTTANRINFDSLLGELVQMVHVLDPNHPVTHAAENLVPLDEVLATGVDFYGTNSFKACASVIDDYAAAAHPRPLAFLEFGCNSWWEEDWANYSDEERAQHYVARAARIERVAGMTLGGCAFAWLDKSEGQHTGWGLVNADRSIRPEYSALSFLWSGARKR
jgi:beta-galactosidase/beta-glucuronidase